MKRTLFVTIAMFALVGLVRADELDDSYAKLKDAVEKKDADAVKAESANARSSLPGCVGEIAAAIRCRQGR